MGADRRAEGPRTPVGAAELATAALGTALPSDGCRSSAGLQPGSLRSRPPSTQLLPPPRPRLSPPRRWSRQSLGGAGRQRELEEAAVWPFPPSAGASLAAGPGCCPPPAAALSAAAPAGRPAGRAAERVPSCRGADGIRQPGRARGRRCGEGLGVRCSVFGPGRPGRLPMPAHRPLSEVAHGGAAPSSRPARSGGSSAPVLHCPGQAAELAPGSWAGWG